MYTVFIYALLDFCVPEFPAKSEKNIDNFCWWHLVEQQKPRLHLLL